MIDIARNTMKRLKTLRHPSLVTYLDGVELPTKFYIVTESITPLRELLPDIKASEQQLSWGLLQVLVHSPSLFSREVGNLDLTTLDRKDCSF